jgi:hypothetical protein
MRECSHDAVGNHALLGFQTALVAKGGVRLILRYGAAMAPNEISFQMNAKQAGRLAQGLLLAMSVDGGRKAVARHE